VNFSARSSNQNILDVISNCRYKKTLEEGEQENLLTSARFTRFPEIHNFRKMPKIKFRIHERARAITSKGYVSFFEPGWLLQGILF
jgi:hypothetical protein